jgi:hypothetical protein
MTLRGRRELHRRLVSGRKEVCDHNAIDLG